MSSSLTCFPGGKGRPVRREKGPGHTVTAGAAERGHPPSPARGGVLRFTALPEGRAPYERSCASSPKISGSCLKYFGFSRLVIFPQLSRISSGSGTRVPSDRMAPGPVRMAVRL